MSHQPRIAIVEDDLDLMQSTQEFLASSGYRIWGVPSAEAFFRRFTAEPVDVVVLDIGLPGEDGLSVATLLKANPRIAVIILSARDSLNDRLAGMRAGADRYLVKPVNLMELAANIDAVLKRPRQTHVKPLLELPHQATEPSAGRWRLDIQDWLLTAPNGEALKLTSREFVLLHTLIKVQGQAVPKKDLIEELFGARVLNGGGRLNVLLARLRKKAADNFAQALPIKTAYMVGYAFTAPATLT
ncbi:MAG: response regulator transcription factor [Rhodoferax sp.]|uniref:response regulator transcription factor n=1 Tax=Rhodoferax sp. TaxID=50421 RepID=UPI002621A205|nr:response regulator transcription factor [Rhodoferax sp.]MDD2880337.1 response regulator transcription factor [Rhodoferax sp.]